MTKISPKSTKTLYKCMKINYVNNNPREIQLEEDLPPYMTEAVADDIAEIFQNAINWSL